MIDLGSPVAGQAKRVAESDFGQGNRSNTANLVCRSDCFGSGEGERCSLSQEL